MAIIVQTSTPKALLKALRTAIDDGAVTTWRYDKDGDFTHTSVQWSRKAWVRPYLGTGVLSFGLVGQEGKKMTRTIYGVYHGRFISMLLTHFGEKFSSARATAVKDVSSISSSPEWPEAPGAPSLWLKAAAWLARRCCCQSLRIRRSLPLERENVGLSSAEATEALGSSPMAEPFSAALSAHRIAGRSPSSSSPRRALS